MNPRCAPLLSEALDLPAAERRLFLQQATAGDADLQATLLRLLAFDEATDTLLDASLDNIVVDLLMSSEAPEDEADDMQPGDLIGAWRLLDKLGSGGMGSVWLAERADGEYTQQVALKTIKLGMDSAHVLEQFRRERNALARLSHPNIASLIDGGVDARGRPWFAMDHVHGIDLREWARHEPSLRKRLRLFQKLCHAVAHAHQQLVIHRDIKPSNVLVQADGEPKLLDFGIAKLLADDDGEHTATMHAFASRNYAAPEQLRGEPVSTAVDVYALGALLFELLTGNRYASVHELGTAPTRPSQSAASGHGGLALSPALLRGDLDAIVNRAVAEEPERRYASAQALAEDLDNHLSGHPVRARPDSIWYRLRKLTARNRAASLALAFAVLALLGGLAISLQQTARAERQAQRAETITRYLTGLFDASRSNAAGTKVHDRKVSELLEDSAAQLRGELAQQPDVRDQLYTILIEIFDSNDLQQRSLALAQERLQSAEAAWGANDARIAPALLMLAGVHINQRQFASVPGLLQRAQQLLDRAHDKDSLTRAELWRWQGVYAMEAEISTTYAGNPLIKATDLLRRKYADGDEMLAALAPLCMLALGDKQFANAQSHIDELRDRAWRRYGKYNMYSVHADLLEGNLDLITGHFDEAYAIATGSVDNVRKFQGEYHHDVFVFQQLRILALMRAKRMEEARTLWSEVDAQRLHNRPDDANMREIFADLGATLSI